MRTRFFQRLAAQRVLVPSSLPSHCPRKVKTSICSLSRFSRCSSSSSTPSLPQSPAEAESSFISPTLIDEPIEEEDKSSDLDRTTEPEKPKRRKVIRLPESDKEPAPPLPADLNILWSPDVEPSPQSTALPPSDIFKEALNNLLITLHPQTQHRAIYTSAAGPPLEPSLALYCPIEGGDYIIDETVRELARRTKSDVIVIDAVQLAAGEWGTFGKCE